MPKDIGDHLMDLLESERNQEKEQKLKQEIMQLQTKANKLQTKTDNLKKDVIRNINGNRNDGRGQLTPVKLSNHIEIEDHLKSQRSHEVDPKEILDSFRRSQVMQAYAICQGVTASASGTNHNSFTRGYSQNTRHASYHFHPVSESSGKVHGPFNIVLANEDRKKESIVLFSYNFPEPGDATFKSAANPVLMTDRQRKINREENKKPVIPIDDLEEKYLSEKSTQRDENNDIPLDKFVRPFVRSVSEHLSAYVSRMDQVQELLPKPGSNQPDCGQVYNVQFSRDVTKVNFILQIVDGSSGSNDSNEENEEGELLLKVCLKYDSDGRRPKPGCVTIRFSGNHKDRYSKEDLEMLEKQCEVFYTESIADGIMAAFIEEEN